jgi:hypothetical protein
MNNPIWIAATPPIVDPTSMCVCVWGALTRTRSAHEPFLQLVERSITRCVCCSRAADSVYLPSAQLSFCPEALRNHLSLLSAALLLPHTEHHLLPRPAEDLILSLRTAVRLTLKNVVQHTDELTLSRRLELPKESMSCTAVLCL